MTSAAEQLAANISLSTFAKAGELKKRLIFLLVALVVYRIGTYIPLPGVNPQALLLAFDQAQSGIVGLFNMFAGGAVGRMAILALGIMPYISASIIMQLMATVVPSLEKLKKEGERGRKVINQYTRYFTVVLSLIQASAIAVALEAAPDVVLEPGWFFRLTAVLTLLGGTLFLMWLGEQITSRGVGNGISLIIFTGIVAELPSAVATTLDLGREGALSTPLIFFILFLSAVVIGVIVFVEQSQRRILIQYPKRQLGNRIYEGSSSFLPLKLNTAGVIPPIFASSLLLVPATIIGFSGGLPDSSGVMSFLSVFLAHGQPLYMFLYAVLIVFFAFFYTAVVFNPEETAENLRRHGGFIPGVRPGERTAHYIDYVLTRITVFGALYLVAVCLLPEILISATAIPFYFGGTSLLIVVSVTMDLIGQVQGHLLAHQYQNLVQKARLRGKRQR